MVSPKLESKKAFWGDELMFRIGKKNPSLALLMSAAVVLMMYFMMEQLMMQGGGLPEEEVLPESGPALVPEAMLAPFGNKWESSGNVIDQGLIELKKWFEVRSREQMLGSLRAGIEIEHLFRAPSKYVGRWVPIRLPGECEEIQEKSGGLMWQSYELEGGRLRLGLIEPNFNLDRRPVYAEILFLGPTPGGKGEIMALAPRVFELEKEGEYQMMSDDRVALLEVVDDFANPGKSSAGRNLHSLNRKISPRVLSHYFGKIKRGDHLKEEVMAMPYGELMESPDVFRGRWGKFKGRLLFRQRRLLGGQGLPPGKDFYDEAYLLDSDRLPVVFRMPNLSREFKVNEIVAIEGYFIQRYSFKNRLNEATWTPMVVAGKVVKEMEKEFGLTSNEEIGVIGVTCLFIGFFLFVTLRPQRPSRRLRVKKKKERGGTEGENTLEKESSGN